ncbi:SDR family oxidoreductase [Lampropedia puyangensis]|uniref:SDR family oxidoreductase n=1 Tax=Lampropedia puyangensis TaxID=1330072 RepID=A0A4S8FCU4_9BURK|nr:SDR family oxidoreductase [Lampropedia puyangensis]THU05129.1 SDR family oxidoreductase [Lampropedia puyangensis]
MNINFETAFVTGATGLLGNNLVKALHSQGVRVKALVRSIAKGQQQCAGLANVELVQGDLNDVSAWAPALRGCDVVFHTAAYFRDNYKGGSHWNALQRINVDGTRTALAHAYEAGVRRWVQTSSIAVLNGKPGSLIDESHTRAVEDADDYYRSKILADQTVLDCMEAHPDLFANFVLPGWMWGPADIGPTSSGQLLLDVAKGKLPGLVPGSFSIVDARDVAQAQIAAAITGRRGERYLAAGQHMTMSELVPLLGQLCNVKTPRKTIPGPLLMVLAGMQEMYARITGKPILLSLATVRLMRKEANRTHFNHTKSEAELKLRFRPLEETLADTLHWYQTHGWLPRG